MKHILPLLCAMLASCTTSHVMLGQARPATDPASVRIYNTPPPKYEEIALVNADNLGKASFTEQGRVNDSMERLRERSAELGANGVILKGINDGPNTMMVGSGNNGVFTATSVPSTIRKVSGVAIWVP
jgi:hypothetical protein